MVRFEDYRLITGKGNFTANIKPSETLVGKFLRTSIARGFIRSIDTSDAEALPGVVSIFTAEDMAQDGLSHMLDTANPVRDDGGKIIKPRRPILTNHDIKHLGEPIALVIAETDEQADNAVEAIIVDYDSADNAKLAKSNNDIPPVWSEAGDNYASVHHVGNLLDVRKAEENSAHLITLPIDISRITAVAMEPRIALCNLDSDGKLIFTTSTQNPFALRAEIMQTFALQTSDIQVLAPDVGGSFGMKGTLYREDAAIIWACRKVGRAVCWSASRSEAFLSDEHARSMYGEARLGLDNDGKFTSFSVTLDIDIGAYISKRSFSMLNNLGGIAGQYVIPVMGAELRFAYSNTMPISPYRGAGRPEATFMIESAIDAAAKIIGIDTAELRARNFINSEMMPYQTALMFKYDSGDFPAIFAEALELSDYHNFEKRRLESEKNGRIRGIGIATHIEVAGGPFGMSVKEVARLRVSKQGIITIAAGSMSVGQGLETAFPDIVANQLNIDPKQICYVQGDTDYLPSGRGSGGSSATITGGSATIKTTELLIETGSQIAADVLKCDISEIGYEKGVFYQKSNPDISLDWSEIAQYSNQPDGLDVIGEFTPSAPTYPNGCHICEIEIDKETGKCYLQDYVAIEDVGTALYPVLIEGQILGGIVQGISQALGESMVYDETGQIATGSFMDYQMPVASDFPKFRIKTHPVKTKINPLGAKGVGESGTVGAMAASLSAIQHALASVGADAVQMPATPHRIWQKLIDAKK
ncbi:MAG: xanthine dehydrogenase family protein molybdopterin-binding subunit [Alphaproteobacteria bacterium]|jgi:aerobic carbon-monoxide dehydrogenase large subunit|nr:xanthine dehydrogenase family protein molybdopterin-binding subunit [Alphaproteobacteria bacterium]